MAEKTTKKAAAPKTRKTATAKKAESTGLPDFLSQADCDALNAGHHHDPFAVLGAHKHRNRRWIVAYRPSATDVIATVGTKVHNLPRLSGDVFGGPVPGKDYTLTARYPDGTAHTTADAYGFGPVLSDLDQYLIGEGTHKELWRALGAHVCTHEGVKGTHFAVWAPNAQRVSVIGDFNQWDGRRHPMRRAGSTGVWEIFMPDLGEGTLYKYEVIGAHGERLEKADPMGFGSQHPPEKASIVRDILGYGWKDDAWMARRKAANTRNAPISIYEVHLGSWRRRYDDGGRPLSYQELARDLVAYVKYMGFTHIELLPISEFPFDGSWGYQPVGLYAPTVRFGPPHEFRDLVEAAHAEGLGVLLDWVPGHFPTDAHGLAKFDGTALYEHADAREGFHQDWNTLIYNYGRTEVKNYLTANALYWMEEYHLDGLRVDAVASMLYRDYSRNDGEWIPNKDGGRENYEAIAFLQEVNTEVYARHPDVMTVAEESTSFAGVSRPVDAGGLGFGYKWNMGWMNDTLRYMEKYPIYRKYDHHLMTFGIDYAFSENFILPISHDEVVHGKGSMLAKMPGNEWEKFANLRAYYGFMWTHPGKKLLFMGCEFAQPEEWDHSGELNWHAAEAPAHKGVQQLVRDLNALYAATPALHVNDCEAKGFRWIDNNTEASVIAYARFGDEGDAPVIVVSNMTPVERSAYQIGVPMAGSWEEVLNTDAECYGGGNRGNQGKVESEATHAHGFDNSVLLTLPPLATIVLRLKN